MTDTRQTQRELCDGRNQFRSNGATISTAIKSTMSVQLDQRAISHYHNRCTYHTMNHLQLRLRAYPKTV